jgi:hypothetical protein
MLKKKITVREILLQKTAKGCLDRLLLRPGGAVKSTCTTHNQKFNHLYRV